MAAPGQKVILVTGGSGLVGRGIQEVVAGDPVEGENWVFLSSKVIAHKDKWAPRMAYTYSFTCTRKTFIQVQLFVP